MKRVTEAPQAVIEHEELPLPEEVKRRTFPLKSGRPKRKPWKLSTRVEEEAAHEPALTDEELKPRRWPLRRLKKRLSSCPWKSRPKRDVQGSRKNRPKKRFLCPPETQPVKNQKKI
ncbi:hypothetical protein KIF59_22110 [Enterobacter cloacae subsp. cloacae]|nr:hypothetical protein [Enterobacter cloacae subsp. cloacae]